VSFLLPIIGRGGDSNAAISRPRAAARWRADAGLVTLASSAAGRGEME
jgi:hypothetical protein